MKKLINPEKKILKDPITNKVPLNLEIEFKDGKYNVLKDNKVLESFDNYNQASIYLNNYKKEK